jgi:HMG-box domain
MEGSEQINDDVLSNHHHTKKQRARGWKKPADKPKRPLSAYNIFFQLERDRIVNEEDDKTFTRDDVAKVRVVAVADMPKRKDRKIHGKIAFVDLARVIGNKWKNLPAEEKEVFNERARQEKVRYDCDVATWLGKRNMLRAKDILDSSDEIIDTVTSTYIRLINEKLEKSTKPVSTVKSAFTDPLEAQQDDWGTPEELYGYEMQTGTPFTIDENRRMHNQENTRRVSLDNKIVFGIEKRNEGATDQQYHVDHAGAAVHKNDDVDSFFDDDLSLNLGMVEDGYTHIPGHQDWNGTVSSNDLYGLNGPAAKIVNDDISDDKCFMDGDWNILDPCQTPMSHSRFRRIHDFVTESFNDTMDTVGQLTDDEKRFLYRGMLQRPGQLGYHQNRIVPPYMVTQNCFKFAPQRKARTVSDSDEWIIRKRNMHLRAAVAKLRKSNMHVRGTNYLSMPTRDDRDSYQFLAEMNRLEPELQPQFIASNHHVTNVENYTNLENHQSYCPDDVPGFY